MTMLVSQNGYDVADAHLIATMTVPGTQVKIPVLNSAAGRLLIAAAGRWNAEVEPLVAGWCWGFAVRTVRGSATDVSNHASGTAIDLNAPRHPLGTQPSASLTLKQIAAIHRIVDDYAPCLRWGGDYGDPTRAGVPGSRPDVMHIEVIASDAACLQALTSTPSSVTPTTAAAAEEEDAMDIPLQIGADGVFRAIKNCELGSSSALYSAAWVVFNVGFGPQAGVAADVRIAFRDTNGVVMGKANDYVFNGLRNDARQSVPAPDGCGSVTVEGRVYGGAIPSAERLVKPK